MGAYVEWQRRLKDLRGQTQNEAPTLRNAAQGFDDLSNMLEHVAAEIEAQLNQLPNVMRGESAEAIHKQVSTDFKQVSELANQLKATNISKQLTDVAGYIDDTNAKVQQADSLLQKTL